MAPAGSYESLTAAINSGANSVYFGVEQLNMRARSTNNFFIEDLSKISEICKKHNVKTYLTVNTVLYDHDINLMKNICDKAKAANITAIIASDHAAIAYCNQIQMPVHISTQVNVSNYETVKYFSKFADVIVLARELTLKQISDICKRIKENNLRGPSGNLVEIEIFAHGALCIAISGKCHMSLFTENASANRGACIQNCRREYKVVDLEDGHEFIIDNKYVMSPKDLCTIGFMDQILQAGVSVLKIEGRARAPEYVHTVVKCYREAADAYLQGTNNQEKVKHWIEELEKVYNRGFWHGGYYLGKEIDMWSATSGSVAKQEKQYIGVVLNYFSKAKVAHIKLEAADLQLDKNILVIGPTTGVVQEKITSIQHEDKETNLAKQGTEITIPLDKTVRKNDKVYIISEKQ